MLSIVNTTFVNWLLNNIEIKGWSQSELARQAGLSASSVSDVISGRRNPGVGFCDSVAVAFKLPPEEVYRVAGLLPEEKEGDQTLYRIQNLYHTLREDSNKERALQFLQFLSDLEDKDDRKGKKPK